MLIVSPFNGVSFKARVFQKSFNEYGIDGKFLQVFQHSRPSGVSESQANDTYNAFNLFGDYELTLGNTYWGCFPPMIYPKVPVP